MYIYILGGHLQKLRGSGGGGGGGGGVYLESYTRWGAIPNEMGSFITHRLLSTRATNTLLFQHEFSHPHAAEAPAAARAGTHPSAMHSFCQVRTTRHDACTKWLILSTPSRYAGLKPISRRDPHPGLPVPAVVVRRRRRRRRRRSLLRIVHA